jgi:DNA gyrase/topoisomerase IV subunit B
MLIDESIAGYDATITTYIHTNGQCPIKENAPIIHLNIRSKYQTYAIILVLTRSQVVAQFVTGESEVSSGI